MTIENWIVSLGPHQDAVVWGVVVEYWAKIDTHIHKRSCKLERQYKGCINEKNEVLGSGRGNEGLYWRRGQDNSFCIWQREAQETVRRRRLRREGWSPSFSSFSPLSLFRRGEKDRWRRKQIDSLRGRGQLSLLAEAMRSGPLCKTAGMLHS